MDNFSPRENDVIRLLLQGKSNKQIAFSLGISERTIEFHLKNVFQKMGVGSRVEFILKLGKSTANFPDKLVESTVSESVLSSQNGKQTDVQNLPEESLDRKTSVKKEKLAMKKKLDTILPAFVVLLGVILISTGISVHKYGAVGIGIIAVGVSTYRWITTSKQKNES